MSSMVSAEGKLNQFLSAFLEHQVSMWDSYVDLREAYLGEDGEVWTGITGSGARLEELPFRNCTELFQVQGEARILERDNEFAKNVHKNRKNYIIGSGHIYTAQPSFDDSDESAVVRVQNVLDKILKLNRWHVRQPEIKLRDDRDGETFIRKFKVDDGIMRFRFVEPRSIQPPANAADHQEFGVETLPEDCETVVAYHVDGEPVDASEIQHRKWNTDTSIRRGYPLMYPARHNLRRAEKLLRNMSISTEIQTAIALIRKHRQATQEAVRSFVQARAKAEAQGTTKNRNVLQQYGAGSILDVPEGQDYDIPKQLDPSKTISALQAELRAVASLVVMPEFMVSSDASNSNFASTMVAEGPAVKNFEAEQQLQIGYDLELFNEALEYAEESGLLNPGDVAQIKLTAEGPSVMARDKLKEAQARQINMGLGILSPQSATAQIGYEYEQEQLNIENHQEKMGLPETPLIPSPDDA